MKHFPFARIVALSLAIGACGLVTARGDLIVDLTPNVSVQGSFFFYEYTLANDAASTVGASSFFLDVSTQADLQSVSGPAGWDVFYASGDPFVEFASPDTILDLPPGSQGSFSFLSRLGPGDVPYLVRGLDESTGAICDATGLTQSATRAVPEPASIILLVIGGLGGAVLHVVRRRATS